MDTKHPSAEPLLARVGDLEARVAALSAEAAAARERRLRAVRFLRGAATLLFLWFFILPALGRLLFDITVELGLVDVWDGDFTLAYDEVAVSEESDVELFKHKGKHGHKGKDKCVKAPMKGTAAWGDEDDESDSAPWNRPGGWPHPIETPYTVLDSGDNWEVRSYVNLTIAQVTEPGDDVSRPPMGSVRLLLEYIGGKNNASTGECYKLPMTVPLYSLSYSAGNMTTLLVLPAKLAEAPEPKDPRVQIVRNSELIDAVAKLPGRPSKAEVEKAAADMRARVSGNWTVGEGPVELAQFDPPWLPARWRKNEVLLPAKRA
ncbi:SOUL heme-binding protein-domain-containing protein [Hyaloraphidium curvatum]|nr:SOUL heme-binding protein-domain-containing protein [Hyaloraphidium curvatum]